MELQTAIEILVYHQEWRLGKREDMIHEPKKLTQALDIVLEEVKKNHTGVYTGLLCEKCNNTGWYKKKHSHIFANKCNCGK